MRKIWIALTLFLIIVLGGGLWWTIGKGEEPGTLKTWVIQPETLDQEIFTTGKVVPRERQELRSLLSGKVDKVYVKEGDQVRAGQVLIQLDTSLVDAQVEQAEAGVEAAQANLHLATNNLETAIAAPEVNAPQVLTMDSIEVDVPSGDFTETNSNLEVFRPQKLIPTIDVPMSGRISRSAGTTIKKGVSDNSPTVVTQAEMRVTQAEAGLKQAEAALKAVKAQREQHSLKAVIEGTVTEVSVSEGSLAPMQIPLVVISNLKELGIEAELNEIDGGKVRPEQKVTISSALLGANKLNGVVEKVGLEALTKTSLQAPGSTYVKVGIVLNESPQILKPGFTVDVRIVLASKQGVLAVPYEALFQEGNKTFVYVIEQGKLVRTEVIPGAANDTKQEILSGLDQGDRVVLNPSATLFEGMDVKVTD